MQPQLTSNLQQLPASASEVLVVCFKSNTDLSPKIKATGNLSQSFQALPCEGFISEMEFRFTATQ